MSHDPEAFAELVVLTIKAALAPVTERLAVAEQANRDLQARVLELSGLRDRLTTMETKQDMPVTAHVLGPDYPVLSGVVDLVLNRVTALETKAAPVLPPDLTERVAALETRFEVKAAETAPVLAAVGELTKDIGAMRERVAVVEVRGQVPGPAGKDGADGADGLNGKDGADGLGFEDLDVEFDGDRTVALKFERGSIKKAFPITFPFMRNQGVFVEGKSYTPGDVVAWGGGMWHCNTPTTSKPMEGSKDWTLVVKRGRDGKDGRDGRDPVPVVRA